MPGVAFNPLPSPETFKHGDWPFQSVSCPGHQDTRSLQRICRQHCQPCSVGCWSPDSAAQKVAPGWSLGGVGQPVPACQVSLAAPSRLESNCQDAARTQAHRRFDRTGFTNSVWFWVAGLCLSCSHPFPAPTITSLNRHLVVGRVVPGHRVWAGTLASFGPVGRHACNPTRFGTAGGSACCRVPRLPAPNGMSWASHLSQERIPPLCSIQHGMRNAKRTARTEDPAALQLFAPGLRCREQSRRGHGLDSRGTGEAGRTGTSIGPEGLAPRWRDLTNVVVGLDLRHEGFRPPPCCIGTVPGASRRDQNCSMAGLLWVMGIPPGASAPCKLEPKLGLVGGFPLIPRVRLWYSFTQGGS